MDHSLRIINFFIFICSFFLFSQLSANPLRPDQRPKDKKNNIVVDATKTESEDLVKWPKPNLYVVTAQLSNSRIDGFQIANNTKGTLTSDINMMLGLQYFNWRKSNYDFSVGLNIETIKMRDEINAFVIDSSQVLAIGLNGMGRYQVYENLYLKAVLGLQDKIFYSPNAALTGYELQKPMIPFVGLGFTVLFAEAFKIKFGFEANFNMYQASKAGLYNVDSGQGYEIKAFSIWPQGSNKIVSEFFYNSRIQNTELIRTQEQKIGMGVGYLF